jgi:Trypsin-co-occurring domain 2
MDVQDNGVAIEEVVSAVKNAIKLAGISAADRGRDLRVTSIQLTLHTVAVLTAGGGIDFRVPFLGMRLALGGAVARRDTHTLTIVLAPQELRAEYEIRDSEVVTVLVEAINTIRAVTAQAIEGDDPFLLGDSTVDLSFAVTKDGSITLGFNGEFKDEISQGLRIGLGPAA